ncbi:diguanylate cyclase [uncultured Shewanella sp.]|uniref:diguanylate cyclase domain-containing protein n=1 Tax=uncultured Shewanella sp. TaxID=173975 RepID=UPI00262A1E81|nr:diguanylate cyclase [uncultured Shewanella sp.]
MMYAVNQSDIRDPDTGIYNYTYFLESFQHEWKRHIRENESLMLLYLCPNIHENVTQPYLLKSLINHVQSNLRNSDLFGRLDPHRFAIAIFSVTPAVTQVIINRIEKTILDFNHQYSQQHASNVDFTLAACTCKPNNTLHIELLFEKLEQISNEINYSKDKVTVISHL